jgi:predicted transcriptional regulator
MADRLTDTITIRVTADDRVALERIAYAEQRSIAFITRQAVRLLLEDHDYHRSS